MSAYQCPHCNSQFIHSNEMIPTLETFILENWPNVPFKISEPGFDFIQVQFPDEDYARSFCDFAGELVYEPDDAYLQSLGFTDYTVMDNLVLISPICPQCG